MSGFSESDVQRRMAALGLGTGGNSATSSRGLPPPPSTSSAGGASSSSSSAIRPSTSSGLDLLYSRGSNSGGRRNSASSAMSGFAPTSSSSPVGVGVGAGAFGRPPVAPAATLDDDPERRGYFSPPTAARFQQQQQYQQHQNSNAGGGLLSPPVSSTPPPPRSAAATAAIQNSGKQLFGGPMATSTTSSGVDDDGADINIQQSQSPPEQQQRQQSEQQQNHHALQSVNWPALVELLSAVVEKLNCQLSLVDSAITVSSSDSRSNSVAPANYPLLRSPSRENKNHSNSSEADLQRREQEEAEARRQLFLEQQRQQKSWASTLQQQASETHEMLDYHLRHSASFGLSLLAAAAGTTTRSRSERNDNDDDQAQDNDSEPPQQRLSRQLDQLRHDLDTVSREAMDLNTILRQEAAANQRREQQRKQQQQQQNQQNQPQRRSSSASKDIMDIVDAENALRPPSPLEVWTNGYLQRLSVAHDLAHRILFEAAHFIVRNPNGYGNSSSALDGALNSTSMSPSPLRRDGTAPIDQILLHPAQLLSSDILFLSCEQYARCCLLEYEKRMRDRLELYARANFVELNVIVPMTAQVASVQLSLDEKETNLRLLAARASKAEQDLQTARMTFEHEVRKYHRDVVDLRRQNEHLTMQLMAIGTPTRRTAADSAPPVPRAVSAHNDPRNNHNNNKIHGSGSDDDEQQHEKFTPRTKRYYDKYDKNKNSKSNKRNSGGEEEQQQESQQEPPDPIAEAVAQARQLIEESEQRSGRKTRSIVSPGEAEKMMEQVKLQLADEFASPVPGCENVKQRESPLQKLARMSSPVGSPAVNSARKQQLQQQHQQKLQNSTTSRVSSSTVRSPRASPIPHSKLPLSASARKLTMSPSKVEGVSSAASTESLHKLEQIRKLQLSSSKNDDDAAELEQQRRMTQQLESARSTFRSIQEKYQLNNSSSSKSNTATTTQSAATKSSVSPPSPQQQQQQKPPTATLPAAAKSASPPKRELSPPGRKRRAHFDASVLSTTTDASPQVASFTELSESVINSSNISSKLIALERLVLEQRSELSTLKAHLKGIELQEAEVSRKREGVAKSLVQTQAQLHSASEQELKAVNDRLSLVWEKIEEATERLKKNRREVLTKMEVLQRTLRNSEREWNKCRMELAREVA